MNSTSPYPLRISCVDPGLTTGLGLILATDTEMIVEATAAVLYDPENFITPLDTLTEWAKLPGRHRLVVENFHIRPGPMKPDTTPLQVIDHIETWHYEEKIFNEYVLHEPVGGKTMITDEILTVMGVKVKGKNSNHMNDALRHGVTHLVDRRHRPTCRLAYPPRVRKIG